MIDPCPISRKKTQSSKICHCAFHTVSVGGIWKDPPANGYIVVAELKPCKVFGPQRVTLWRMGLVGEVKPSIESGTDQLQSPDTNKQTNKQTYKERVYMWLR